MNQKIKAHSAIFLQIIIIGFSFLFVKQGLEYTDAFTQLSHRFMIATLGVWLIRGFVPHTKVFTKEAIKDLLPLGIFYPVLFFSLQTVSLTYISTLEAGIITSIIPLLIVILAIFLLKERPSNRQKIVLLIAFLGITYINLKSQSQSETFSFFGTFLMSLSALSSAFYTITAKKLSNKYQTIDMTTFMLTTGMLIFTAISIMQHLSGNVTSNYFEALSHPSYVLAIFYLGLLSSLGSAFLSNFAIHHVEASTVGIFSNLSPVITILAGVLILGEPIKSYQIIGMGMILIPMIFMNAIRK